MVEVAGAEWVNGEKVQCLWGGKGGKQRLDYEELQKLD